MSTTEHYNPDAVPAGERVALSSQSLTDCGVITENIADPLSQVHNTDEISGQQTAVRQ